ncbi:hypothetical protein [Micromonospora endophytica]|uniref:Uncharacterized protein n=1 Tax=Micromonospora endophytica TaxID=515350 RepID=A0A2W2DFK5_9ACTN|nr:hypothetical protein [Micromonospora endophytica]PZF99549.1 hypothetical protein C1I93_05620 [Micromonospora endophytica]RIW46802.1 hypothetical protein D3H59_11035 [Micromonospora endophytica]BCJ59185.1 hypothetical protein Jiend_26070 [Micromonospora endophytica]
MPGDNDDLRVILSAFDGESQKWRELATLMGNLRGVAANLVLDSPAFFCGNPMTAQQLGKAYDDIHSLVDTLMKDAKTEFEQIAEALIIARDLYDEGDQMSASDFVKIYGE